jgi:hypothetical protein
MSWTTTCDQVDCHPATAPRAGVEIPRHPDLGDNYSLGPRPRAMALLTVSSARCRRSSTPRSSRVNQATFGPAPTACWPSASSRNVLGPRGARRPPGSPDALPIPGCAALAGSGPGSNSPPGSTRRRSSRSGTPRRICRSRSRRSKPPGRRAELARSASRPSEPLSWWAVLLSVRCSPGHPAGALVYGLPILRRLE